MAEAQPSIRLERIPVDRIVPDDENPNVESIAVFNELVADIKEDGFLEPILVSPWGEEFVLISGEHRWKAAKLSGMTEIDCVVVEGWDDDKRKAKMVKMNVNRGKLDPEKFTRLWNGLKSRVGEERLRKMMGFSAKDAELRRLLKEVRSTLPEEMRRDLDRRAERIRSVEDLASVVQSLYTRYGGTIDYHFVMFSFGGQTHLMIRTSDAAFENIRGLMDLCQDRGLMADQVLSGMVSCRCAECEARLRSREEVSA